ncbi:MAG: GPR endopeptidase [Oscillospiraceae bacterium]
MQNFQQRTDLATEARELATAVGAEELQGVEYSESEAHGNKCQKLVITSTDGANALGKPIGTYYTLDISALIKRENDAFSDTCTALSEILHTLLGEIGENECSLVVGLGNRDITPDAIGTNAAAATLVTRHLKEKMPQEFGFFSPVAVISPGVMGTSGIESADYIKAVCVELKPKRVLVVDALAAKSLDRLCRTVQITDTGITPGSGVGNSRAAINSETLGVPVIALGVPTVVDMKSILAELTGAEFEIGDKAASEMIVTPRSIDSEVDCAGRLLGYAINLALHKGLSVADIDMFLG